MVDNIQLPQDVADIVDVEIIVRKKPDLLRKTLIDLINRVSQLEARVKVLEDGA